ncbi:MAG: LytTR family DNA-binding domain-containing protein [Arcicella sp.]|nr:LytTR family DNA-binding domain-containing protein [Arcicella sp.]
MKTYQQKGNNALLILNHKTSKKVLINNVILIKGDINYSIFCMKDGQEKLVPHTIKFFEAHLETHGFLRVHRGYMINPNYVKNYNIDEESITMANGVVATIARRRKHILKGFMA